MKLALLTGAAALALLAATGARADSYYVGDRLVIEPTPGYDAYATDYVVPAPIVTERIVEPAATEEIVTTAPGVALGTVERRTVTVTRTTGYGTGASARGVSRTVVAPARPAATVIETTTPAATVIETTDTPLVETTGSAVYVEPRCITDLFGYERCY